MAAAVIYADPDADRRETTAAELRSATGLDVEAHGTVEGTLAALEPGETDCVVTTYDLGDGTGTELVEAIRETVPDATVVLYTAASFDDLALDPELVVEYVDRAAPEATETLARLVEAGVDLRPQAAYPLPEDENERLAAVDRYDVDRETVAALDRLTRLAAATFGVEQAAIGLVYERTQGFLACFGAEFGTLDREETVCTHAILEDGVTVVPDTAEDPRFSELQSLRDASIRSYASANLTTPDGHAIGTFCIYATEPDAFDDSVEEYLPLFAAEAMDQLELRRRLAEPTEGASLGHEEA